MLSLDVSFRVEIEDVVSAISKMKNLKRLTLPDYGWGETPDTFSSIFDNMHHLEDVRFCAHVCRNEQDDRMITTLANHNPKLQYAIFAKVHVTDAALMSLAQLQHHIEVSLSYGSKVTTAGVLTLLRGSSRNVIRKFFAFKGNLDYDRVTSEIRLMSEERETTFAAGVISHYFDYEIRS